MGLVLLPHVYRYLKKILSRSSSTVSALTARTSATKSVLVPARTAILSMNPSMSDAYRRSVTQQDKHG